MSENEYFGSKLASPVSGCLAGAVFFYQITILFSLIFGVNKFLVSTNGDLEPKLASPVSSCYAGAILFMKILLVWAPLGWWGCLGRFGLRA